jgi:hypothetical protein
MYLDGSFTLKTAPYKRKRRDVIKCCNGGRSEEDKDVKGIQERKRGEG